MNAKRERRPGDKPRRRKKPAAVLVPLCTVNDVPSILFTLRSATLSSHAGQISFPGGHADCDELDDPTQTALRETKEELLGHDDDNDNTCTDAPTGSTYDFNTGISILGRTQAVPSVAGNMVTPVIGALTYDFPSHDAIHEIFPGNAGEVDEVFALSIDELLSVETSQELKRLGTMGPVFPAGEQRGTIWGLTAIILRPVLHKVLVPSGFVGCADASRRNDTTSKL